MDRIIIHGLELMTHLGVSEEERKVAQKILVDVGMFVSCIADSAREDDLALTVNYSEVAKTLGDVAASHPRKLVETLAEDMAKAVLGKFPVQTIHLQIRKFILPYAEWVGIKIERSKEGG